MTKQSKTSHSTKKDPFIFKPVKNNPDFIVTKASNEIAQRFSKEDEDLWISELSQKDLAKFKEGKFVKGCRPLTMDERRAKEAIEKILYRHNHELIKSLTGSFFQVIELGQFYEEFGCRLEKRPADANAKAMAWYDRNDRRRASAALNSLTKTPCAWVIERVIKEEKGKRHTRAELHLGTVLSFLGVAEVNEIDRSKKSALYVVPHPALVAKVDYSFLKKHKQHYKKVITLPPKDQAIVDDLIACIRQHAYTLKDGMFERRMSYWVTKLGLEKTIEDQHPKRFHRTMFKAFQGAKVLGYINDFWCSNTIDDELKFCCKINEEAFSITT